MQQARLANAVKCKAEVGLRAIAVQMGVQLSNEALHLTTVYWRSRREFVRNPTSAHRSALIISTIPPPAGEFCNNNSREMSKKKRQVANGRVHSTSSSESESLEGLATSDGRNFLRDGRLPRAYTPRS
ncbi:hypothetical protein G5I_13169 [Acromyrmex echinatior]|uniref:Uncharacterized protein n=1 Tax=Acromyrmex echinatior TaxID=103372 RepID=F4X4A9_ACREC|nr:hypothetical protein G5I_13169 [Acromyrmex echinatior]